MVYSPATGELSVDAPAGVELTSINIDSASGIFTGDAAQNLGGSFDNDADAQYLQGHVRQQLWFAQLWQRGSGRAVRAVRRRRSDGRWLTRWRRRLGPVDLVYVPEPSTVVLLLMGLAGLIARSQRRCPG